MRHELPTKPNVIFILADDMGYGDFSAFNPDIQSTKALDSLVRDGVTLTNCYSSSPVCAPSRASIMTGRYPQRCGVIDTLEARGFDRLKLSETTMADVFHDNGYYTGLIGKWHLGAIGEGYHPNKRGFDYFFGFRGGWNYYYNYIVERNGQRIVSDGTYITDVFSNEAVNFIRDNASRPFFLHLAYNAPHFPLEAPLEMVEKYKAIGKYTSAVCKVYAMIECMDIGIGRVLLELKNQGIENNTIVIFTSDNGPDFEGNGDDCLRRYNCDFKGSKMFTYEGGLKVPAVVRWPSKFSKGVSSKEIIHGNDWLPTLISLCDLKYSASKKMDGIDFSRALQGQSLAERTLFWHWNRFQPNLSCNAAIRKRNWKMLHAPIPEYLSLPPSEIDMDIEIKSYPERYKKVSVKPILERRKIAVPIVEMYDISEDPCEKKNVAPSEPDRVQSMEKQLQDWFAEVESERLSD